MFDKSIWDTENVVSSPFPEEGEIGNVYIDTTDEQLYLWDADTNAYIKVADATFEPRIINLENTNVKKTIWEEITAKGIVETVDNFNGKTSVDTTLWESSPYNAEAKEVDAGGNYTGKDIFTSGSTFIHAVIQTNGDYTLSGTPNPALYPRYAIVYNRKGTAKEFGEEEIPSSQILETIEIPPMIRDVENGEVRPRNNGDNINLKSGGLLDDIVTFPVTVADLKSYEGTCLLYGGEISINALDNTKIDIEAGKAQFINNYTNPAIPTVTIITWAKKEAISLTFLPFAPVTFLGIDSSGNITQNFTAFSPEQEREFVTLGLAYHPNLTTVSDTASFGNWGKDTILNFADYMSGFGGRLIFSGEFIANGSNLLLDRTDTSVFGLGLNYGINKKNPNSRTRTAETDVLNFTLTATSTVPVVTNAVPSDKYDKDGLGVLFDIPDGYYTTHRIYYEVSTNQTLLQYGQFVYDSQKKAALSWEQEEYITNPISQNVPLKTIIPIIKGCTDLTDSDCAKFVQINVFGDRTFNKIQNFSQFAESIEAFDGMSYQRPSITYVNVAGTLYADIEAEGGGDITYMFNQKESILNCTTGAGVNGRARIALTAGASYNEPVFNYIYVTKNGQVSQLNASEVYPTGEFGWVVQTLVPDATTFDSLNVYSSQRFSDDKSHDGRGALSYEREKIRSLGATWLAGVDPTITITDLTPDTLDVSITQGQVSQLHIGNMPALDSATDGIFVLNKFDDNWFHTLSLGDIQTDVNGDTLNNRCFNFVILGIKSSADGTDYSHLAVSVPNGSYLYTQTQQALDDESNTSITSVPTTLRNTAFLIARLTLKYKNGVWNNVRFDLTGEYFQDLRGDSLGSKSGGGGGGGVTTFLGLTDTPATYVAQALKIPQVASGETALEFTDSPTLVSLNLSGLTASQNVETDASKNLISVAKNTAFNLNLETDTANIKMNGTVSVGVLDTLARADHIHASDTSKENTFSKNTAFNKDFGTITGTVCQGDDSRLSDSRTCDNTFDNATTAKTNLSLENVDNTSDADKPVSTATQTALDLKADDNEVVKITGNQSIAGIKDFTDSIKVNTITVGDNSIFLNAGETGAGVTKIYAGLEIDRGTLNQNAILFNETQDNFRAGEFWIDFDYDNLVGTFDLHEEIIGQISGAKGYIFADTGSNLKIKGTTGTFVNDEQIIGQTSGATADVDGTQTINDSTQALATREDTPTNEGVAYWNSTLKIFQTHTNLKWDGSTLNVIGEFDVTGQADIDNININGNKIATSDINGDLTLDPNGTGDLVVDAYTKLGSSAPATQEIEVTGTCSAVGGNTLVGTSLTKTKILSWKTTVVATDGIVAQALHASIPAGLWFFYDYIDNNGNLRVVTGASAIRIAGQSLKCIIKYKK